MKFNTASKFKRFSAALLAILMLLSFTLVGCMEDDGFAGNREGAIENAGDTADGKLNDGVSSSQYENDPICKLLGISDYSGKPYAHVNGGVPTFTEAEITTEAYEFYSELDSLGRCGYVMACVGKELMPTDDREEIGSVKPTGWVQKEYSADLVNGRYIYNRCHLIGFQLTGENANKQNLITGTRYMNWDGMVEFENMIADYIKETDNHVMYRVTPMFYENELVARGVHMEAYSVEDGGEGICFNVFAYNVQPGIYINYATGDNRLGDGKADVGTEVPKTDNAEEKSYVLNKGTKKIHKPDCPSVGDMKEENKVEYRGSIDELLSDGYEPCKSCKPE